MDYSAIANKFLMKFFAKDNRVILDGNIRAGILFIQQMMNDPTKEMFVGIKTEGPSW